MDEGPGAGGIIINLLGKRWRNSVRSLSADEILVFLERAVIVFGLFFSEKHINFEVFGLSSASDSEHNYVLLDLFYNLALMHFISPNNFYITNQFLKFLGFWVQKLPLKSSYQYEKKSRIFDFPRVLPN